MIDVVIPYYDAPERLTSILVALDAQIDHWSGEPLTPFDITVADDASDIAPTLPPSRHRVDVVRLDEGGYHAAAARNRGAECRTGNVIVFIDGDTVPAPDYVSRLVEPIVAGDADLTTGRRRHADFDGLTARDAARFVAAPRTDRLLGEPQWLAEGLARTDLLRSEDTQVFEYVISAVMAVERTLFELVGGFDESFDTYGGEDWELASRLWNHGGRFFHVPDAVAFHDGPDVEGREPDPIAKTIENLRILDLVPASPTRLAHVGCSVPAVEITVTLRPDDLRANAVAVLSILRSEFGDFRLRLIGGDASLIGRLLGDARIDTSSSRSQAGPRSASVRCLVTTTAPVVFGPHTLGRLVDDILGGRVGRRRAVLSDVVIEATSVRAVALESRHGTKIVADEVPGEDLGVEPVGDQSVAAWCRSAARDQQP